MATSRFVFPWERRQHPENYCFAKETMEKGCGRRKTLFPEFQQYACHESLNAVAGP